MQGCRGIECTSLDAYIFPAATMAQVMPETLTFLPEEELFCWNN